MLIATSTRLALVVFTAAAMVVVSPHATAQSAQNAAPAVALQPYTAPDQSASAGVPSGWHVTKGGETVIAMTGPQGETVTLGLTIVAHDAAFQLGQRAANGIDLSMPFTATLAQKLTMIYQQGGATSGRPIGEVTIASFTPLQLPAAVGQCGRVVAGFTGQKGPTKVMAVVCSLPRDAGGNYKNILLAAQAPASVATQSAPAAQAIFRSYTLPPAWLQKKLAPVGVMAPMPAMPASAGGMNSSTINSIQGTNNSVNCFSLGVLRQTPTYDLPRSCGGTRPD